MATQLHTFVVELKGPATRSLFVIRSNVPRLSQKQVIHALRLQTEHWRESISHLVFRFQGNNGIAIPTNKEIDTDVRYFDVPQADEGYTLTVVKAEGFKSFN